MYNQIYQLFPNFRRNPRYFKQSWISWRNSYVGFSIRKLRNIGRFATPNWVTCLLSLAINMCLCVIFHLKFWKEFFLQFIPMYNAFNLNLSVDPFFPFFLFNPLYLRFIYFYLIVFYCEFLSLFVDPIFIFAFCFCSIGFFPPVFIYYRVKCVCVWCSCVYAIYHYLYFFPV